MLTITPSNLRRVRQFGNYHPRKHWFVFIDTFDGERTQSVIFTPVATAISDRVFAGDQEHEEEVIPLA